MTGKLGEKYFTFILLIELTAFCLGFYNLERVGKNSSYHTTLKIWQLKTFFVFSILWNIIIIWFLWKEWNDGSFTNSLLCCISALWVPVLFLFDIIFTSQNPSIELEKSERRQSQYVNITSIVMSATFAFGVCFSAINPTSERRNRRAAIITLAGLLIGVAFVVPVFEVEENNEMTIKVQTISKCACIYSVGLFICGAAIELIGVGA